MKVHTLVIHHSASPRTTTPGEIDGWHRARGWSGIGYHYTIDQTGTIRAHRDPSVAGAHAPPNTGRLGVCAIGDNTRPGHEWNPLQWQALADLVRACRIVWPEIEIVGHRDLGATECPGISTAAILRDLEGPR